MFFQIQLVDKGDPNLYYDSKLNNTTVMAVEIKITGLRNRLPSENMWQNGAPVDEGQISSD